MAVTQLGMSLRERNRRYTEIRSRLAERDVDVVLVVGRDGPATRGDFRYLAGYGPVTPMPSYVVFPREEAEPVFLARTANRSRMALETGWINETRSSWTEVENYVLEEVERVNGGGKIGISRIENLPVPLYLRLGERFGADNLVDVADVFREVRLRKSDEELEAQRQAGRIADEGYRVVRELVKPGMTDREFYGEARRVMHTAGSEYSMDLVAIDVPGVYAPIGATLGEDGFVVGELTPTYLGLYNQLPFEFTVGKTTAERAEAKELLREAHEAMVEKLRPGTTIAELWEAGDAVLRSRAGFSGAPGQYGHDLGYDVVDGFSVLKDGPQVLQERNVLVLHPIVVPEGRPRMLLGRSFAITADGCEPFNDVDPFAE